MGQFTGWRCDGPKCDNVSETEKLPAGWIKVVPIVDGKVGESGEGTFTLCSNKCMMTLGKERYHAAVERGDEKGSPWLEKRLRGDEQ